MGTGLSALVLGSLGLKCLIPRSLRDRALFWGTTLAQIAFPLSKILIPRLVMTHI